MTPAVSVIVSIFNSERYLEECAQSLRAQTLKDFEVVLVDPGSADRSPEICRRLASEDDRFRYLPVSGSTLVSYCRARAVEAARAPLIAVLDSDDRALPDRLQTQWLWMQAHPEAVLVGSNYRVISANGWILRLSPLKITDDVEIRWRLLFGNCLGHSTVMYRRDAALRAGNYDPRVRAGEDFEFFSRMPDQGRLAVIPRALTVWRGHPRSLSITEPLENKSDFLTTVQSSIQRRMNERVPLPVAAALYDQSRAPAESPTVFMDALGLIERAERQFRGGLALTPRESRLLSRAVFLQLIRTMSRNSREAWWASARNAWIETTRRLTVRENGYRWYTDGGLVNEYKLLLKSDWRFLLMRGLY
jgi:glycosyltransferase involved in cell wall biosynthesis